MFQQKLRLGRHRPPLVRAAQDALHGLSLPKPEFEYLISWAESYDHLLRGVVGEPTTPQQLISVAFASGRVLLCGRGGSGKTTVVRRLAVQVLEKDILPVIIDLRKWTAHNYLQWSKGPSMEGRLATFLENLAQPALTLSALEALLPAQGKLFFVDGLNEVPSETAHDLLVVLDDLVAYLHGSAVIVTDRLVRRSLPDAKRWRLANLLPLSDQEVARLLIRHRGPSGQAMPKELLHTPFFLNEYLKEDGAGESSAAVLEHWFLQHASLSTPQLDDAADAAYRMYAEHRSRMFPLSSFKQLTSADLLSRLIDARALLTDGASAYFDHHLKHDYLAARYLAKDRSRWNPVGFDTITLKASSFDSLSMALEQVEKTNTDRFVRAVYDWNLYGAAYAMASAPAAISRDLRLVVLAVLTERQWDVLAATAQRARDALSAFGAEAQAFQSRQNLPELVQLVNSLQAESPWFDSWRDVFTRPPDRPLATNEKELLTQTDSIAAWTLANVLKRGGLTSDEQAQVRSILRDSEDSATRWRLVHILGAYPTQENMEQLFATMDQEPDYLVRYGAIRSLVEIAARATHDLRGVVMNGITNRLTALLQDETTLNELLRAVFVSQTHAPSDWAEAVSELIKELYFVSASEKLRERWLQLAHEVEEVYRA